MENSTFRFRKTVQKVTRQQPEFIVYTGPMFSSKTSRLLAQLERYKYQKKKVLVCKPKIDDRYDSDHIVSHIGLRHHANIVEDGTDILKLVAEYEGFPDVVALDEAFMINGMAEALIWLYRRGISIVVSTLDLSSNGKPFDEVKDLLVWSTMIVKCPAVCTVCGADAFYTHKKLVNDDEIQVGGSELYEPRCFQHHVYINDTNK